MNHLMNTYARLPVTFTSGQGATLIDQNNQTYLDAVSGIAVCSLGHAHPAISEIICQQSKKLIHTSNLYEIEHQTRLAEKLTHLSNMDRVFFTNSGAEANEAAIKIARKYGLDRGIEKPQILVMENSFHGRTLATIAATGNDKVQAGFGDMMEGFIRVPFDDLAAIQQHTNNRDIVAILVEPIQGEGGVHVPKSGYLQGLRGLCDANNWLLMVDEIQTGIGRTGKWFAHQHEAITPDVMTLAKALGNGFPIGACLAKGSAAEVLAPGNHGTTFGGNPLACAVGACVINNIETNKFHDAIAIKGAAILTRLKEYLNHLPQVVDIRGQGYMIGIQLDRPCGELVSQALEKNLLINVTRGDTIRLLPAFVMTEAQTQQLIDTLVTLVTEFIESYDR